MRYTWLAIPFFALLWLGCPAGDDDDSGDDDATAGDDDDATAGDDDDDTTYLPLDGILRFLAGLAEVGQVFSEAGTYGSVSWSATSP